METNILINKSKFELKFIKIQPSKLISEELKPGYTKFTDGKYFWSKQRSYKVEAYWISDDLFDGITERQVNKGDLYQVIDGKLYLRPKLEIIFENNTIIERFDTDKELNDRVCYLREHVFTPSEVKLAQFNTEDFEYRAQSWY